MIDTLFIVWMLATGFSLKSPNVDTIKAPDFEVSLGFEYNIKTLIQETDLNNWVWTEREAGERYNGVDLYGSFALMNLHTEIAALYKNRQAQDILKGEVRLAGIFKDLRVGLSASWDHMELEPCGFLEYKGEYLDFIVSFYREGFESSSIKWAYQVKVFEAFIIEPMAKYEIDRQENQSYQVKLNLKLKGNYAKRKE